MKQYARMSLCMLLVCLMLCNAALAEGTRLYAIHTEGDLNIREAPEGSRVGYLLPGDEVTLSGFRGEWIRVKCGIDAGGGYVHARYISSFPEAAGTYCNESNGSVNVRKAPGGRVVDRIRKGETAEVYSVFPDKNGELWGFIGTGYVSMEWLTKVHEVGNEEKHLRHGR